MQMYHHFKEMEKRNLYKRLIEKFIRDHAPSHLNGWKSVSSADIQLPQDNTHIHLHNLSLNERLLSGEERCDTAEEIREMVKLLRALGALSNSKGFSNLLNAIIDEAQLQDLGVKEDQKNAFGGIKPNTPPRLNS